MVDVKIEEVVCEYSGFCMDVCPEDVFAMKKGRIVVQNPDECTECWLCVQNCPTGAVTID